MLAGFAWRLAREIRFVVTSETALRHWSDGPLEWEALVSWALPLAFLAPLFAPSRRGDAWKASLVGIGGGLAASIFLLALVIAGAALRSPNLDLTHIYFLVRQAASPFREARVLLLTLTLLPLFRLAISAQCETLRQVRVPAAPGLAFVASMTYVTVWAERWYKPFELATVVSVGLAGVLCGRGLRSLIREAPDHAKRRAEAVGLAGGGLVWLALGVWNDVVFVLAEQVSESGRMASLFGAAAILTLALELRRGKAKRALTESEPAWRTQDPSLSPEP